jgi:ABC-2 type transport system ATP-binding protein
MGSENKALDPQMIYVDGITKTFGKFIAVDGLTFQVKDGEIFGLLGPNGAGKTTTIRMLACLISKTSGDARIDNFSISNKEDSIKIRRIIGLVAENVGLYEDLSAYRNIDFYGKLYGVPENQRKENIKHLLEELGLWEVRDRPVATFSKGMKQKVAIARALSHDPKILFMDEPTANLDPEAAKVVRDSILDMKKEGKTIIVNTHNLDEAQRICDTIGILKTKLIAIGSPEHLKDSLRRDKTVIELEEVTDGIVSAIKAVSSAQFEIDGRRLIVDVRDPRVENPVLIKAITSVGGSVVAVNQLSPTMEDVYLKAVRAKG